ncbi:hypothetical protein AZH43_03100 [Acinetobacter pragensis]|uniref:Uncharacterized protein n=1 Tax=Acinetobacter pragensis TaxID=1806892 RepID=A0A151XZB9_9GAMM|nr:hypothetical protein AZH43_03100 [Acinetobacter pragensis]
MRLYISLNPPHAAHSLLEHMTVSSLKTAPYLSTKHGHASSNINHLLFHKKIFSANLWIDDQSSF